MEPAALSKRLVRIEELFGTEIVKRSSRGFIFTGEGEKIAAKAAEVLANADDVFGATKSVHTFDRVLTIGARGFLNLVLSEPFLMATQSFKTRTRLRFLDMSPTDLHRAAIAGALDLAVHFEETKWTSAWTTKLAGEVRWRLFGSSQHPLGVSADLAQVITYPFIAPGYWTGEKLATGDDGFPVPWRRRIKGYEVQTALNAFKIVSATNHLVFLPDVFSRRFLQSEGVSAIEIADAAIVKRPLFVSGQVDRINQREFSNLLSALQTVVIETPI
jgi:DNA-binding transcriptional LysR family regulator